VSPETQSQNQGQNQEQKQNNTTCIRLNGTERILADPIMTIADLLIMIGMEQTSRGIAVACNGAVIPRSSWETTKVMAGDDIDIIRPFVGG
jgi:sulfur carrier protein